jgi:hypothetical protein
MMMMATSVAALFFGVTKVAAQGEPSGRAIRYPMVAPSPSGLHTGFASIYQMAR